MKTDGQQSNSSSLALPSITPQGQLFDPTTNHESSESMALKLSTLWDLGFDDDAFNADMLKRFDYNLERTIDFMLDGVASSAAAQSTSAAAPSTSAAAQSTSSSGHLGSPAPLPGPSSSSTRFVKTNGSRRSTSSSIDESISTVVAEAVKYAKEEEAKKKEEEERSSGGSSAQISVIKSSKTAKKMKIEGVAVPAPPPVVVDLTHSPPPRPTAAAGGASTSAAANILNNLAFDEPECPICLDECPQTGWTTLKCKHKLCTPCHSKIVSKGTTMSGSHHSYIKCPLCQSIDGVQIGNCPDGSMRTSSAISGYVRIDYSVSHPKYGLNRTAYIESTLEGQRLVELLKIAWDRRLCFAIGTSLTTGRRDTLVWNIHHKTSVAGGEHGYPDPTYLLRLAQELRQYGIE
jgi:deltex-like protein